MPIKPENKDRYPKNWKTEIRPAILKRANDCCEFCGRMNHSWYWSDNAKRMVRVVLTIAHLDHTPENCDPSNLRALCQRCHLQYDAKHHKQTRQQTRAAKDKSLNLFGDEDS